MPRLALMDKKRVAVGIGDDGHVADRRFQRLHGEGNARGLKLGDGGLEALDLKGDRGAHGRLGGGLPKAANGKRARTDVGLGPKTVRGDVALVYLQVEQAFIEVAGTLFVSNRIADKGDFVDLMHHPFPGLRL
jgi:hypothetical protein